jgi:DNA-binding HxlR family transcriptional regulator
VSLALDAIGDRWSLLILRDLVLRGKQRYQEFLSSEEGISTNILADRLARLERQGLISKSADPGDKRQFLYAPTEKSFDLLPVVFEMARWSLKYEPTVDRQPYRSGSTSGNRHVMRRVMSRFLKRNPPALGPAALGELRREASRRRGVVGDGSAPRNHEARRHQRRSARLEETKRLPE